jgi:hypothetical protein
MTDKEWFVKFLKTMPEENKSRLRQRATEKTGIFNPGLYTDLECAWLFLTTCTSSVLPTADEFANDDFRRAIYEKNYKFLKGVVLEMGGGEYSGHYFGITEGPVEELHHLILEELACS